MESGGFFNAEMLSDGSYDMNYVAEQFAQYFALFVGNGIFVDDVNNLQASSAGGMNVKFNKGAAFWDGYWYINSESLAKVVDINLDASARIDSFVVRFDISGRKNGIEYKKGDTSVQRADGVYELQLCTIRVDAGSTSITDSNITDTRTNENVCGFVKGLLEVVQTDDLFRQFSSMFNTWFDKIKGVLDGDTAGNILGMIGLLDDLQTDDKSSVVAAINEVKQKNDEQTLDIEKLNKNLSNFQQSFQDGCSTIASAITEMGVATADNASPDEMAENIKAIETKTGELAGVGAKFEYSGTEGKWWSGAKGIVYWKDNSLRVSVAGTYSVNGASAKRYAKGATVYSFSAPTWGETNAVIIAVTYA